MAVKFFVQLVNRHYLFFNEGLCFTKIENGRPSFGACCFTNGYFESHSLIGYYHASQPTPKPIYKKNRIVLGGNRSDVSSESFINANEIWPGVIAAQCPMTSYPEGFDNTIEKMKKMLIEQDIRLWVQLSPSSVDGEPMTPAADGSTKSFCDVFPIKYLMTPPNIHQKGVSNFLYTHNMEQGYFNFTYTLTAFVQRDVDGNIIESEFDRDTCNKFDCNSQWNKWETKTIDVQHIWFYKWDDFATPLPDSLGVRRNFKL